MLGLFVCFVVMLIVADILYIDMDAVGKVIKSRFIRDALVLSIWTSVLATLIALLFAIPVGYVLSRYRFRGHIAIDTVIDLPIIFPPLVAGLTLLVFFYQTSFGRFIEEGLGWEFAFQPKGIVLCQFFVSASYAIRSAKTAFDDVDRRFENVALTLGCGQWGSFRRVSLPLAANGIIAGGILTWARAFGLFGPLMIFVGNVPGKTQVLSTSVFYEQSIGHLEVALAIAIVMILVALFAIMTIRLVGGRVQLKL
jgi:molybdate transport system permease protein